MSRINKLGVEIEFSRGAISAFDKETNKEVIFSREDTLKIFRDMSRYFERRSNEASESVRAKSLELIEQSVMSIDTSSHIPSSVIIAQELYRFKRDVNVTHIEHITRLSPDIVVAKTPYYIPHQRKDGAFIIKGGDSYAYSEYLRSELLSHFNKFIEERTL